jgi:uncharacterized phage protein gp47/JayE
MPIQQPQSSSIFQAQNLAALQATGITQTNPGGKARAFSDIVGDQMGLSEARKYAAIGQTLLPYATGDNLDFIGAIWGFPRLSAQTASSSVADSNFTFYVLSGTFGQINGGQPITVPAGTAITTGGQGGPVYTLDIAVTLPANSSSVPFSATSTQDGTVGNVPAGTFTACSFQGYTDFRYGSLLVTNNYGITEGMDAETDDNYRYRLNLFLQSKGGASQSDIELALLTVPGVQTVAFVPQAGTFLVYIYGVAQVASPSLLQACQTQLNNVAAYPLVGTAVAPDLVGISLATTLSFVTGATPAQQQNAISAAITAASNYINNLALGATVVINEIASIILNADPNILDIGQPNQPLSSIYIWRDRADGTRYSRYLVADYTPQTGERIIVENSITNPIQLTPAS